MEGKLNYKLTGFDESSGKIDQDSGILNLARDLSAINRKGFEQTTRKGVPLVYHCKMTVYRAFNVDRPNSAVSVVASTAPSNWVTRNAAVKLHAAREAMFSNAGIRKSDRGRYDKTIRYGMSAHNETPLVPICTDGNSTYTDLGEWDLSKIAIDQDTELVPLLYGPDFDESAATTGDSFNLANAYLNSRRKIDLDDLPAAHGAADHSILRSMFNVEDATDDELQVIADDNQDLPPYDQDNYKGTYTAAVASEILMLGNFGAVKDVVHMDIPFGLATISAVKTCDANGVLSDDIAFAIEVLGISEMQG